MDLHGFFRAQEDRITVDRVAEMHTLFFDFTHRTQAEHLEAAGIGEDRTVPVHEIVQVAMQFHDLLTRAQPQVESVAQ
ncbi:hypothetical protein D3C73_1626970 [compost metagenome]